VLDILYAPLLPRPATRLRPLERRRGGPGGSQHGQAKSDLPWTVSQRLFDPYQAGMKVYRTYRVGERPTPQTTLGLDTKTLPGISWGQWFHVFFLITSSHY
jgi:hypothetical protein